VDEYADVLFRYALLRVRTPELAEELVQETFLAALRGRESYAGQSSEQTWLVGILRRKIVDHFRAAARMQSTVAADLAEPLLERSFDRKGHWKTVPAKWRYDPSPNVEDREFWAVFDDCVTKLPPPLADTFCLRELEELGTQEVCKILGISASNLWTMLHRARMQLRECLERNWFRREG
jgi:RNA polymerase sigma-70 factor (ECF subfamily)